MEQITITDFWRYKFPPNCEPECKKHGTKCIAAPEYKGRMMDRSLLQSVKRPNSVISNSSASSSQNDNSLITIIISSSIIDVIKSKEIREDYNLYLNKLQNEDELKSKIQLYQLVTSDNFLKLIESLHIDDSEYRELVMRYGSDLGFHAIEEIYRIVKTRLQRSAQNTDYKMLTPRNVMVTEDIESLGISDFASIQRIFTDIKYHRKYSASPSLVFNGKLAMGAGSNAVKARNTLVTGQMFFFKCFPVGKQTIDIEKEVTEKKVKVKKIVPTEIEYDTEGLQTEIKMYTELLKLVKYNITPNILCKIATAENVSGLGPFLRDTNMMAQAKEFTFNEEINVETLHVPKDTVWKTVSLISTHKGGDTLKDLFIDLSIEERRQVMFQIIYNMYVFDKLEISQGDLHSGNMLINVLPEEVELCYLIEGVKYCVKTKHLVKYFDLDRGMIGKTTTLHFDKNQTAQMNKIKNPIREDSKWNNRDYGLTEIYNKNLELVNLVTHRSSGLLPYPYVPDPIDPNLDEVLDPIIEANRKNFVFAYPGKTLDEHFNRFMRQVMPGCVSAETINYTYARLLVDPVQKEEADRIFGVTELKRKKNETDEELLERSIKQYKIGTEIGEKTWKEYFLVHLNGDVLGHIVKSENSVKNNHLWIPDSTILPKIDMLKNSYFDKYKNAKAYDITEEIVYTIDGMI